MRLPGGRCRRDAACGAVRSFFPSHPGRDCADTGGNNPERRERVPASIGLRMSASQVIYEKQQG
jgi:hypothetical protein